MYLEKIARANEYSLILDCINKIKSLPGTAGISRHLDFFLNGYNEYNLCGKTPIKAYIAMRQLYCLTNGVFNNLISNAITECSYKSKTITSNDVFFGDSLDNIVNGLNSNGIWIFKEKINSSLVDNLNKVAKVMTAVPRNGLSGFKKKVSYADMKNLGANIFDFNETELVSNDLIWEIVINNKLKTIAAKYLKCDPIIDSVNMWWSFAKDLTLQQKNESAQLYHFDLDRLSFLKFFIYASDVSIEQGPTVCIPRTHRGYSDIKFRRDGRFTDEEVGASFPKSEISILGERGTLFAVDTKCLHKGMPLVSGERLMFQIEFSNSLFGADYAPFIRHDSHQYINENPTLFAKFQ